MRPQAPAPARRAPLQQVRAPRAPRGRGPGPRQRAPPGQAPGPVPQARPRGAAGPAGPRRGGGSPGTGPSAAAGSLERGRRSRSPACSRRGAGPVAARACRALAPGRPAPRRPQPGPRVRRRWPLAPDGRRPGRSWPCRRRRPSLHRRLRLRSTSRVRRRRPAPVLPRAPRAGRLAAGRRGPPCGAARSACASSIDDEWLLTPIPRSMQRSSASLFVSPSSRASS